MYSKVFADEVRYIKETEEGRICMCKIIEDHANEVLHKKLVENAKAMLADGVLTLEKIAMYSGLTLEEVEELAKKKPA